jgi:hypothetical protein
LTIAVRRLRNALRTRVVMAAMFAAVNFAVMLESSRQ